MANASPLPLQSGTAAWRRTLALWLFWCFRRFVPAPLRPLRSARNSGCSYLPVQADRDWASLPPRLLAGPVDFPAHFVCPFTRALFRDVILLHGRLLFALRVRSHWELIASRWEPAFSSHLRRKKGSEPRP